MGYGFEKKSKFTGKTLGLMGIYFLVVLLSSVTCGIAAPWASCILVRWMVKNSVIDGKRFEFKGTGARLFGKMILWAIIPLLMFAAGFAAVSYKPTEMMAIIVYLVWCIFLFFYIFWVMLQEIKWYVKNIHFAEEKKNELEEGDAEYFSDEV